MHPSHIANAALIARPGWFAHRFDPERDLYHLVPATVGQLRDATFLTDVNLPDAARALPADRKAVLAAATGDAPVHFLFHSAFCCSTLLARALDGGDVALALKEPVILNDLMGWRDRGGSPARVAEALDHALRVLVQPARVGQAVLIKPSNLVNPLIAAAMALRPNARALLLYAPLRTFLESVASKGLEGRLWVRDLWAKMLRGGIDPFEFGADELFRHSDLQVAALGWLAQHRTFASLAHGVGPRVATLSSAALLADPARALAAAAGHYGLAFVAERIARIVSGPIFNRHAKSGEAFDADARRSVHRSAAAANGPEIDVVERWATVIAEQWAIPMDLPRPLLA